MFTAHLYLLNDHNKKVVPTQFKLLFANGVCTTHHLESVKITGMLHIATEHITGMSSLP